MTMIGRKEKIFINAVLEESIYKDILDIKDKQNKINIRDYLKGKKLYDNF